MKLKKPVINKIIVALFVLLCIGVLAAKLPCSYTILTFEFESVDEGIDAVLSVNGEDGVITEQENEVKGSSVSFSVIDYYPLSNISVDMYTDGAKISNILMSSRNHVVYKWSGDRIQDSVIYCNSDSGMTSFTMSDSFIKRYNQIYGYDWRLKLDILIPLICIFIVCEAIYLISKKFGLRYKLLIVLAIIGICCFSIHQLIDSISSKTYLKVGIDVEPKIVTSVITDNEVYEQSFLSKEKVCGISIRFATYGEKISGDYILRVYDAETDDIAVEKSISGSSIKDNNVLNIIFDKILESNHEYRFSVVDKDEVQESLVIWRSETDQYDGGSLYEGSFDTGGDLDFDLIAEGPNITLWVLIFIGIFAVLAFIVLFYRIIRLPENLTKIAVYVIVFIFCLLKMNFYYQYLNLGVYDEMAQVSYVAYLEEIDGGLIPEFEEMTLLMQYNKMVNEDPQNVYALSQTEGEFEGKFTGTVNYLGHPPLYYQIMRLTNSISSDGDKVYVNLLPLRIFNMVIVSAAILLMFYIGFTRLKKPPVYHLLFALLCTSVPILCYEACMISNDNLTLLAVVIFIIGALRFTEKKAGFITYLLIALGISMAMLTKTTAGIQVVLTAVIFIIWSICKEKSAKIIFNKYFAATLPVYLLTAAYFIIIYFRYGTFQPSLSNIAYEQYVNYPLVYKPVWERTRLEFWEFAKEFLNSFITQWKQGTIWPKRYGGRWNIGTVLLWAAPVVYALKTKLKGRKECFYVSMAVSVLVTIGIQFIRAFKDFQYISGHGGMQSRYYVCVVLLMALIMIDLLGKWFYNDKIIVQVNLKEDRRIKITANMVGTAVIIFYCYILIYAEVIYNLINSVNYKF